MHFFIPMNDVSPLLLLLLGGCVGIMSGFYGIGGGWLITPVLNIIGMPMKYAIGTSLAFIIITSGIGTLKHRKLKNVNIWIGVLVGVSAILGVKCGKSLIDYINKIGNVDKFVRNIYIVFLVVIGVYMLFEKKIKLNRKSDSEKENKSGLPPYMILYREGKNYRFSIWYLVLIGIFIGILSSTMGVGGGFILLPIYIYIVKLPVTVAVGTSLMTIIITSISGAVAYIKNIDYAGLFYMVIVTIFATAIGVKATEKVDSAKIKNLFALTVLAGSIAVFFKQIGWNLASKIFIFSIAVFSTLFILIFAFILPLKNRK